MPSGDLSRATSLVARTFNAYVTIFSRRDRPAEAAAFDAFVAASSLQVRAGRVLFSWAYRMERIVNASVMPTVFDPQQRVIQRFSSRMRAILDSSVCQPFRAVHGGFNGGFERRPTGRCLTLLSAEHAKEQLAILRDPAVIAAWRHAITPPPAIPAK